MGANSSGQLGDGSTTNRSLPKKIDENVSQVSAGSGHRLYVKTDGSFWAMGSNQFGQLGDGTTTNRITPLQIYPTNNKSNATLDLNATVGGTVTGGGTYDLSTEVFFNAIPSSGYLFEGWSGDYNATESNVSLIMDQDYDINTTFAKDTGDTDGDGLTNYAELVIHFTDPEDSDSDDDTLTDSVELQIGTEPNEANTSLMSFFDSRESAARSDGNASGIAYVQANPSTYSLYTESEKNASETAAKAAGQAEGAATMQAEMASKGLALVTYIEQMEKSLPYTQEWFYQPGMGWLWTQANILPYIYQAPSGDQVGGWLYFSQLADQPSPSFYDYATETWITPTASD